MEAAGVELDWGFRPSPMTGEFWPDFAIALSSSEHTAAETQDVAGNREPFRGALGEAAGTRSGGNVLRRLHGVHGGRGNLFPIGYLMTVITGEIKTCSRDAITARNCRGFACVGVEGDNRSVLAGQGTGQY